MAVHNLAVLLVIVGCLTAITVANSTVATGKTFNEV